MRPVHILGISAFYHDSAAVLLRDGKIIAAAQEERFSRNKHDPGFPKNAIDYCLSEGHIGPECLDAVTFYEKPLVKFERLIDTYRAFIPDGFESFRRAFPLWAQYKLMIPETILKFLGDRFQGNLLFTDHHESHAASAFFPSPFEEAAILTLDAVGEWSTSSIGHGQGASVKLLREMRFPHSLGMLYSAFTYFTGFKVNSGEYKLMGLAPYGTAKYVDKIIDHIVEVRKDGSIWLDMSYFNYCQGLTMTSEKFHGLFGWPPRPSESRITQKEMDIAASIQTVCEEVVMRAADFAHRNTNSKNLVMAGGVALNCVANGRLRREGPFEQIWIQPAAGDAGGALGAALLSWHRHFAGPRKTEQPDSQKGSLLGPAFSNTDIGLFLDSMGAAYRLEAEEVTLVDTVSELMAQEKVIGWFQGRMEFGPRALGCRSIIGDARSISMQKTMNLKIKYRESFRPFAPCVLSEFAHEVFEMLPGEDSPYMLFVAPVRESWRRPLSAEDIKQMQSENINERVSVPRSKIPAITHVDYSARVQTVDETRHGRFYRLMRQFYQKTGCPVIVNTSFNIRGEPIVCTPEDAFRCFMATDMDYLVLENHILSKADQPAYLYQDTEKYRDQYELD